MATESNVETGKVVHFNYTLRNDRGEVLDQSGATPMAYLHGAQNIVPGLEREMTGHGVGDTFDVVVSPTEGYGERVEGTRRTLPRSAFEGIDLQPGMQMGTRTPEGQVVPFWIVGVAPQQVEIDFGHPLAGESLHFAIEITEIRDATEDELSHGHPHGPGGAH